MEAEYWQVEEALYLSNIASKVTLIHRRDKFRAEAILVDKIYEKVKEGKIELELDKTLEEVIGDDSGVTGIKIKDVNSNEIKEINLLGVFIAIGHKPNTSLFEKQLDMENGYIITEYGRDGNSRRQVSRECLRLVMYKIMFIGKQLPALVLVVWQRLMQRDFFRK